MEKRQRFDERIAELCIRNRVYVLAGILLVTVILLGITTFKTQIVTKFSDLLPQDHQYIQVHNQHKTSFGGSNLVSIMVQAEEGTIFNRPTLEKIKGITRDLRTVRAVNEFQITSLASRKIKKVKASTFGIKSTPLMWPDVPEDEGGIRELQNAVMQNPLAYGTYVSRDLKAALITVDFIDRLLDSEVVYREISDLLAQYDDETVEISAVGNPILHGKVASFLNETILIFAISIAVLGLILLVFLMRSWRGTLLPIFSAFVSGIWALGIAGLFGINMDPLGVVIAFLVTARVISHCVQSVNRFDILAKSGVDNKESAAKASLMELFKPGLLSVVTDAGGILVVTLAPIPLLQKTALIGAIWVGTIAITGIILTPVLLSYMGKPNEFVCPIDCTSLIDRILQGFFRLSTGKSGYTVLAVSFALIVVCGFLGSRITVGDASPGSPLLWQDSDYNTAVKEINEKFLGTDRMFVVVEGDEPDALKKPEVLDYMQGFQKYVERQPEVGGSRSLVDIIPVINYMMHEGNPRYMTLGESKMVNGEYVYMYLAGSNPGDLAQYSDPQYQTGGITLYFRDHKGSTIRTAITRMKDYISQNKIESGEIQLAGGLIGVLAAVNEVIFFGQVESIALALMVVLFTAGITYRNGVAGVYLMIPIIMSNAITFTYMYFRGIGLNVNTLPVAALGIGLGVDYSIYVADAIKENFHKFEDVKQAIFEGLNSAGRGVVLTASPLILSTAVWYFMSSLRFQAEMALLIAIWMAISAFGALIVIPAMLYTFKPAFVFNKVR
jgi:predicted RND superfamily exporter protein